MNITDQADHDELAAAQQQYQMAMTNADQFSAGLQVAELLSSQSRFNEALAALQLIRPLACSTVDQASLQQKLGWAQLRLCQYDLAYQHFCDALSLLSSSPDSAELFQVYYDIAWLFYRRGQLHNARIYCEGAQMVHGEIKRAGTDGLATREAAISHILGLIEAASGNLRLAAGHLNDEIAHCRLHGKRHQLAGAYNKLASIHLAIGDIPKALELQAVAHATAEECGDAFRIALSLKNYGDIYYIVGDLERSLDHYQRSLQISLRLNNQLGEVFTKAGMARIFGQRGDYGQAQEHLDQALAAARQLGNLDRQACILVDLAELHCRQGAAGAAREYLSQADKIECERGLSPSPRHQIQLATALLMQPGWQCFSNARLIVATLLNSPLSIDDEESTTLPELEIEARLLQAAIHQRQGATPLAAAAAADAVELIGRFTSAWPADLRHRHAAKPAIVKAHHFLTQLTGLARNDPLPDDGSPTSALSDLAVEGRR